MKRLIYSTVIFLLQLTSLSAIGQDIQFRYDESGNRTGSIKVLKSAEIVTDSLTNKVAQDEEYFKVYPNPVSDFVYIDIPSRDGISKNETYKSSLFTEKGELLKLFYIASDHFPVDLSGYSPGVYLLIINTKQGPEKWTLIKY